MKEGTPPAAFALRKMTLSIMPLAGLHKGRRSRYQLVSRDEEWRTINWT